MKLYLGSSIWMRYVIRSSQSKFHSDPDTKMCLGSHRRRKKLDYQFTMIIIWISYAMIIICYFSRSRMHLFSIYLVWQMIASLLIYLKHKASMCMSLASPSVFLLGAISRQKWHWHLSNVCKSWFIFTLFLTRFFFNRGWPVALTVRHSIKIAYFISH